MLEYESLQGISSLKPTGFRKRSSSIDDTDAYTMTSLLQQLSYFYSTMCQNGLDPELVRQAVKQLFYLIGAVTLNSLFLRKDMCSCRKGMQIRYRRCTTASSGEESQVSEPGLGRALPV